MTMFDFAKMQEASYVTKTKGTPFEIVDARTPEKFNAKGELKGTEMRFLVKTPKN